MKRHIIIGINYVLACPLFCIFLPFLRDNVRQATYRHAFIMQFTNGRAEYSNGIIHICFNNRRNLSLLTDSFVLFARKIRSLGWWRKNFVYGHSRIVILSTFRNDFKIKHQIGTNKCDLWSNYDFRIKATSRQIINVFFLNKITLLQTQHLHFNWQYPNCRCAQTFAYFIQILSNSTVSG